MFGMKKNVFQKADMVRQLVNNCIGQECSDKQTLSLLGRASSYDQGHTKTASDQVRTVLTAFKTKGINTNTAYKYVKMSLVPAHIREKIYNRKISTHRALSLASSQEAQRRVELENKIFDYGMKAIKGLRK
ncbi:hypothetical protein JW707_02775 [Candidatus Woesearchaeota archaeon]|nr:hypothetical protein [Candidatus Woesearchaeota archaeon]